MPKDLKRANVTPIFRKGKKEDPGSYSPVSLTLILVKVMEQIFTEIIYKDMKGKNVMMCSQHGYTKGKSCLTNLITFCSEKTDLVVRGKSWMCFILALARILTLFPTISLLKD